MKKNFLTFAAMAACVAFTACSNEDDAVANVNEARLLDNVTVGIKGMNESRSGITSTSFSNGETIGLFVFGGTGIDDTQNSDYTNGTTGNVMKPLNIPYKLDAAANWWKPAAKGIVLSTNVGHLYAYYPYSEASGNADATAVALNVVADQASGQSDGTKDDGQVDYMYGKAAETVSNSTATARITLNHALAKMTFKFKRDTYPGAGVISKIQVKNAEGKEYQKIGAATMHIGTGDVTVTGAAGSVFCQPTDQNIVDVTDPKKVPAMLVYPTAELLAAGDLLLEVEMDGQTYEIALPHKTKDGSKDYKFEKGNSYNYTIKLTGREFGSEQDDIVVEITPWNDVEIEEGSLTQPKPQP